MEEKRYKRDSDDPDVLASELHVIRTTSGRSAAAFDDDEILDVARECLLDMGLAKMTIAELARRAGVSRVTVYRRWPSAAGVIAALINREWKQITLDAYRREAPNARERIINAAVEITRTLRTHPIQRKIVESDPEFLVPYLLQRRSTSMNFMLEMLRTHLRLGQLDGSVRQGDPQLIADSLMLLTLPFSLISPVLVDEPDGVGPRLDEVDGELRYAIERYLLP